jgi:predicted DNA-binding protein (UPF0251 family)
MLGFKPFGIAFSENEPVVLNIDELEALRLTNYDNLQQTESAEKMNVSQPTFTRIYNSALIKITKAFVEGNPILIEGGNFIFEQNWYKCKKCYKLFEENENHIRCGGCNRFDADELFKLNSNQ